MKPFGVAADADLRLEELAQAGFGEQVMARAVAGDAAIAHEDDALDLGQDIAEVVGDHDDAGAFAGEAAEGFAEFALRSEVERVGRLVEEELPGAVNEGSGDEDAALFSCRHGADKLAGEMGGFDAAEGFARANAHFISDVEVGPES